MKTKKQKTVSWLEEHFRPHESFLLGNIWFAIIAQSRNECAVKRVDITRCEFAPDEGEWISWPEKRYETLGGAYHAIILNYEKENKK
jgi:hypothetical protein